MPHWSKAKKSSKRPTNMTIFFRFQLLYCLEKPWLWNKRCKMIKAGEQKQNKKKILKEWVNVAQVENYSMLFIKMPLKMWQQRPLFNNWLNFKTSSDYRRVYFADKYFATKCADCHFSLEASIYEVPGRPPYCEAGISGACQTSHALHASLGNHIWYQKIERHLQKKEKKENSLTIMMQEKWYTDLHCSSNIISWQGRDVAELYYQTLLSFRIKKEISHEAKKRKKYYEM